VVIFASHRRLPVILRVWCVAPMTLALIIIGGTFFTLPPGPLCDEGMVLFMEGSCDWGGSNIFFFSKLGLLVALNIVFVIACRSRVTEWRAFAPHFAVLVVLAILNWSEDCPGYYSHPNGSFGQMIAEGIAFAALGSSMALRIRRWLHIAVTILAWNALHVAAFYASLNVANHWTWAHTACVMLLLTIPILLIRNAPPLHYQ
jgi:hypothetical protein